MGLWRKLDWLGWIGPLGGVIIACIALSLLYDGLASERVRLSDDVAASALRQLDEVDKLRQSGDISPNAAHRLSRDLISALNSDRVKVGAIEPDAGAHDTSAVVHLTPFNWDIFTKVENHDIWPRLLAAGGVLACAIFLMLAVSLRILARAQKASLVSVEKLVQQIRAYGTNEVLASPSATDENTGVSLILPALEDLRNRMAAGTEREKRLTSIIASVDDAILLLDEANVIEFANPAAVRLFGPHLCGRAFTSFFEPADRTAITAMLSSERSTANGARKRDPMLINGPGGPVEIAITATPVTATANSGTIAVITDMTERLGQQRELLRLATRDQVTGLPNRGLMETFLDEVVADAQSTAQTLAVLSLDLSRFKLVTDTLGQRAGESLLIEVGRRIAGVLGPDDIVGRVGIDDFLVILPNTSVHRARRVAEAILNAFGKPVAQDGLDHFLRPSVGIALFPEHGLASDDLIRAADTALYAAKRRGGMQAAAFERRMGDQARHRLALDHQMRHALNAGEFVLHFQPKVSLVDYRVEGFEALIRWNRGDRGLMAPSDFLPVAEETGFIAALDEWVLSEVCRILRDWRERSLNPVPVAVNVSPRHLRQCEAHNFLGVLDHHRIPTGLIEIEVTEHAVMQDIDHAMSVLGELKENGMRVAVDDFGTGHSSLNYLSRLPISTLKIDRSFINGVPSAREDCGIVSMIISMADLLRLDVVAEGVERPQQAQFLRHHNCKVVQGWLTGRPVIASDAELYLSDRKLLAKA